jgi:hypothetical protein
MLRVKLGLSEDEIMNRPWILTQIESSDFPWYSSTKNKVIKSKKEADEHLSKYMK